MTLRTSFTAELLKFPRGHSSVLPLVRSCANLHITPGPWNSSKDHYVFSSGTTPLRERIVPFHLESETDDPQLIGVLRPQVADALLEDSLEQTKSTGSNPWNISRNGDKIAAVSFAASINEGGRQARQAEMNRIADKWNKGGLFPDILQGWSNEQFPVYYPPTELGFPEPIAFTIERAALPLFGFPNFGCLAIGFYQKHDLRHFWVSKRSETKKTWPGSLDVTVGGGLDAEASPLKTLLRECVEEASLSYHKLQGHTRSTGAIPFLNRSPQGWILPGFYYLYELHLPKSRLPKTNKEDGEVHGFEVMRPKELFPALLEGKFKPSSALAFLHFLIRHSYITAENEPRFAEVVSHMNRPLFLQVPWKYLD